MARTPLAAFAAALALAQPLCKQQRPSSPGGR